MYKMLTVCLTLSFIFGETNLKNQTSLTTDNIKKVKSEVDSNVQLIEVSKNVEKSRFEGLNKINKREKKKKQASSKAKKGIPVLKMNYETNKQVFLNSVTESVAQKNINAFARKN